MSDLARQRIAQAKATRATTLDLGRCGLSHWPEELWELTWLEELTLSNRWRDYENGKWIESQNQGPYNLLREIPAEIARLSALTHLRCGGSEDIHILDMRVFIDEWGISDISVLQGLSNLQSLSLYNTPVEDISVLQGLSNLQSLSLSGSQIKDISVLQGLSNLQSLSLYNTPVEDISVLQGLSNLQSLYLYKTPVEDISVLQGLSNLKAFSLSGSQIKDISVLQGLSNLQSLSLYNTPVEDISVLQGLSNLQSLSLSDTKVSDISVLKGFGNLQALSLSDTQVSDISVLQGLSNLKSLDFSGSQIKDISPLIPLVEKGLPVVLKQYFYLGTKGINLYECAIEMPPPDVIKQGNTAILNYFRERQQGEEVVYEA